MPISERDVAHLARLANLELDSEEIARLTRDLGAILEYAERLPARDEVLPDEGITTPLREDVPGPVMEPGRAVSVAPDRQSGLFKVPPVLGGETSSGKAPKPS